MIRGDELAFSMTDPTPTASSAPPALAAFLRGVERRGALFAQLQCGDAEHGDVALATVMRTFSEQAPDRAMADWPRRFWQLLMAAPALQREPSGARWPTPLEHLGTLAPADRRALLSRLAAGLPEDEAVEVLGTDLTHYRAALAAACPQDADGQPDAAGWRSLAEAIQQQMRDLAPERLARLARLRERALRPDAAPPRAPRRESPSAAIPSRDTPRPETSTRWRRWAVVAIVLACAGGLAVTFLAPPDWSGWMGESLDQVGESGLGLAEEPDIQQEALDAAEAPAATVAPEDALPSHPDLALLLDPESESLSGDAAFLAWYLAARDQGAPTEPATTNPEPVTQEEGRDTTF